MFCSPAPWHSSAKTFEKALRLAGPSVNQLIGGNSRVGTESCDSVTTDVSVLWTLCVRAIQTSRSAVGNNHGVRLLHGELFSPVPKLPSGREAPQGRSDSNPCRSGCLTMATSRAPLPAVRMLSFSDFCWMFARDLGEALEILQLSSLWGRSPDM